MCVLDWDLAVCLQYECKRKQLHKPDVLNSWIDLRATYRVCMCLCLSLSFSKCFSPSALCFHKAYVCVFQLFYSRKPKGLNGALQDLGIQFSGREHSGRDNIKYFKFSIIICWMDLFICFFLLQVWMIPVILLSWH